LYKLAVIVPFFKSIESNVEQEIVNEFSALSDDILKDIQLIIIDDCSPVPLSVKIENKNLNIEVYRIDTDIEWNVGGAKNLGAYESDAEKVLFLDADRCIGECPIRNLVKMDIDDNGFIVFVNGKKGSPGTFCTTKKRFMELNGFDEKFSGNYGFEDINYRKRHEYFGGTFVEVDNLISTRKQYQHHTLIRNREVNRKIMSDVNRSGLFLNFEWHKVDCE
jgi:hypothetical protein